ncbi:MAG: MarR family transcriptional regulator [Cloacibacillus sp.]
MEPIENKSLAVLISRLQRNFKRYCEKRLKEEGLNISVYYYLKYIEANDGCTLNDLTRHMHVDKAHTTRIVRQLETLAWTERGSNQRDMRESALHITALGKKTAARLEQIFFDWDAHLADLFSEAEADALREALSRAYALVDEEVGGAPLRTWNGALPLKDPK